MRKSSRNKRRPPPPEEAPEAPQKAPVSTAMEPQHYSHTRLSESQLEIKFLTRPFYQKLFNSEQWELSDRLFRDWHMGTAFKYIVDCKASVLKLDYNKCPNLLKSLTTSSFPNLTNLYLGDNTISSIELLGRLNAPSLKHIHLNDNPITETRSLRRLHTPNLQTLSLKDTRVNVEIMLLGLAVELHAPALGAVYMHYRDEGNLLDRDYRMLAKVNWKAKWRRGK